MLRILSIDLEDWFHILGHHQTASPDQWKNFESRLEQNVERLLGILEEHGAKATWFCLGWIAGKYPGLIKKISRSHHIACHSDLHELVFQQDRNRFREDTLRAKQTLESLTGKEIKAYRAAGFSVRKDTPWFFETLLECGFDTDCSIFPAWRLNGGLADSGIRKPCRIDVNGSLMKEFPLNTLRFMGRHMVFSGGGYFRLLPYSWIRYGFNKSDYVMTYFHPRDFDPDQPVIKSLPLHRKFMSYTGLKSSEKKLRRLLQDHTFVDIPAADLLIDWTNTAVVKF